MNKDAILATLIGFGIGLLITGLLLLGPNVFQWFPKIKLPTISLGQKQGSEQPTPTPSSFSVTIDAPLPESIEGNDEILVSGSTRAGATVVITGPVDDVVVVAGDDGKYAGKISLTEGKNDFTVTAYQNSEQQSKTQTAYYTPEEL